MQNPYEPSDISGPETPAIKLKLQLYSFLWFGVVSHPSLGTVMVHLIALAPNEFLDFEEGAPNSLLAFVGFAFLLVTALVFFSIPFFAPIEFLICFSPPNSVQTFYPIIAVLTPIAFVVQCTGLAGLFYLDPWGVFEFFLD